MTATTGSITAGSSVAAFERLQARALADAGVSAADRYVELHDPPLRAHVLEIGHGDPVVLVHGGNSVAASWSPLLPGLGDGFRLLLPDRPGCGLTGAFDYRGVDLRAHGAAFIGALLDALGLERAALVGNSMGGYFALAFALAHPERVARLALLGEPAGSSPTASRYHRLIGTRGLNTLLYATALRPPRDAAGVRASWARGRLVADTGRVPEPLAECLAAGAQLPWATRGWLRMVERVFVPPASGILSRGLRATHALIPELHRITCPVLFLWGDRDPLGSPDRGRELASHLPDARVEVVADAGHLPWIDQPQVCGAALARFLAE